jgi:hypothetical protein
LISCSIHLIPQVTSWNLKMAYFTSWIRKTWVRPTYSQH